MSQTGRPMKKPVSKSRPDFSLNRALWPGRVLGLHYPDRAGERHGLHPRQLRFADFARKGLPMVLIAMTVKLILVP